MQNDDSTRLNDIVDPQDTLGGRIEKARLAQGLTRSQLARRVGVLPQTLKNWETDRSEPRVNKMQLMAATLRVPFMWLLGGETSESVFPDLDEPRLDETSSIYTKVEKLIALHEQTTQLLFEVQSEISRLQREIDEDSAAGVDTLAAE